MHYEAPPANRLPAEVAALLNWINGAHAEPAILQAGIAFLWFVALHPFADGNGRVARALADLVFCRKQGVVTSLSSVLRMERKDYYGQIEMALKGDLDVSGWLRWFSDRAHHALEPSPSGGGI